MSPNVPKCKNCASERIAEFTAEMAMHFPGLDGLEKPIVWAFPKIPVCLDCGQAEFLVPERELEVLRYGIPVEGALVSLTRSTH